MTDELVLLSLQRALLGVVTPELRGVTVGRDSELVRVRFLVDGPVGASLTEASDDAEAMLLADLDPAVGTAFEARAVRRTRAAGRPGAEPLGLPAGRAAGPGRGGRRGCCAG